MTHPHPNGLTLLGGISHPQYQALEGAWDHWGAESQMDMVIEESAELTHAILTARRHDMVWSYAVVEELADLLICLQQIEIQMQHQSVLYGSTLWDQVLDIRDAKMGRLQGRLEEAKEAERIAAERTMQEGRP